MSSMLYKQLDKENRPLDRASENRQIRWENASPAWGGPLVNPTQSHLLELKITAIKNLEFDDFLSFIGLRSSESRINVYEELRLKLSDEAREFWDGQKRKINQITVSEVFLVVVKVRE